MYLRAALATGAVFVALGTAPAQAQTTTLPVRQADGVKLTPLSNGTVRLTFTKKAGRAYREIAGKRIVIGCWDVDEGFTGGEVLRAPKRRSSFLIEEADASKRDLCEVRLDSRPTARPPAAVPLTQAGAVYLDERSTAARVLTVLFLPGLDDESKGTEEVLTWEEFRAAVRADFLEALQVVELVAPGDTPPPGKVGYFGDGDTHLVVAAPTATGRRLFFEVLADGEVRTNILGFLVNGYDD